MCIIHMNDGNYCLIKGYDGCLTYSANMDDYLDCGLYIAQSFNDLFWMAMTNSDRIFYNNSINKELHKKILLQ